jgi:hypothetical protein
MNDNTTNKVPNEAFMKTRDYFLGESLKPTGNVPDLLAENRKIAISLAESVMSLVDVIANHFGVPTMELAMAALPEVSLQLEADGIREQAAARTYLDLKGAVPLADICKGTYAYPAPTLHCVAQEILRRERFARYSPHDPLLQRIFGGSDGDGSSDDIPESEPDEEEDDDTPGGDAPKDGTS